MFLFAGLRARTAFVSTLALTTYSEFALITTRAVVDAKLLPAEWNAVISLAVAGSLAIAAPLNRYSHVLFSWFEPFLVRFEKKTGNPDRLPESFGVAEWLVIGMGRTGVSAYQALSAQEQRVVGLDATLPYWKTCWPKAGAWSTATPRIANCGADCAWSG